MIITVEEGQTIVDVAIQEYGCYEGVFVLCQDNNFSLDQEFETRQQVYIQDVIPDLNGSNREVVAVLKSKKTIVNNTYIPVPTPPIDNNQFTYTLPFNLA